MIQYASIEDQEELYHAMLLTPAWQMFLNRVVRPEVLRLRRAALMNTSLGEAGHLVVVKQLTILKETLVQAYKIAEKECPKELLSWFE